jgi:hypothetical protein
MTRNLIVVALVAALMAAFVVVLRARTGAISPPVKGYVEGREFRFAHTEASDSVVADTLSDMTGSPVLVVKSLAETPDSMLAPVYVFTNGVRGDGPLGYQPDIFDRPPGTPGYTPLRRLHLVKWKDPSAARELKSAEELLAAERAGELSTEPQDVVINMPFLTWPGGSR